LFPIHFFKAYFNDHGEVFSNISNTKYLYGFIKGKTEKDIPELKKSIVEFSNNYKWNEGVNDSVKTDIETTLSSDTPAIHGGLKLQIEFYPNLINHRQMDTFWAKLMNIPVLKPLKKIITRTYYFGLADAGNNDPNFDQISVHFKNLDRIRDFSTFIYSQNDSRDKEVNKMEIDETKIRDKENFNFLSTVTAIISTLLIIFSTVAISLFIFNLLKMHLLKVKMNLGTFKAIGLGENETRNIYFFIIISFIAISSLVALVLASFAGELLNSYLISNLILEEDVKYFKIFDWVTFATLLVILITSVLVSWFTINKIISKSPGDLIYNR
jgi:ABC-type antimicrobial peptide transport system permease subunit